MPCGRWNPCEIHVDKMCMKLKSAKFPDHCVILVSGKNKQIKFLNPDPMIFPNTTLTEKLYSAIFWPIWHQTGSFGIVSWHLPEQSFPVMLWIQSRDQDEILSIFPWSVWKYAVNSLSRANSMQITGGDQRRWVTLIYDIIFTVWWKLHWCLLKSSPVFKMCHDTFIILISQWVF